MSTRIKSEYDALKGAVDPGPEEAAKLQALLGARQELTRSLASLRKDGKIDVGDMAEALKAADKGRVAYLRRVQTARNRERGR